MCRCWVCEVGVMSRDGEWLECSNCGHREDMH